MKKNLIFPAIALFVIAMVCAAISLSLLDSMYNFNSLKLITHYANMAIQWLGLVIFWIIGFGCFVVGMAMLFNRKKVKE